MIIVVIICLSVAAAGKSSGAAEEETEMKSDIGTKVIRKRDGATGTIVSRSLSISSIAHPGIYGKTIVSVRLDNADWNGQAGGDQVGDLGWLKSYFKEAK